MSDSRHITFVGGGTVGHIAKLMAVMQAVYDEAARAGVTVRCSYIGLADDLERPIIANSPLPFEKYSIASGKLNRYLTWRHIPEAAKLAKGWIQAKQLVRRLQPDCIFTNGGFVTVPVAAAASKQGIPMIAHETDVIPGMANRYVARFATLILTTYPTRYYSGLPLSRLRMVGQPVRADFYTKQTAVSLLGRKLQENLPMVTVICGSQGARRVNSFISHGWQQLLTESQVVHVTGAREYPEYVQAAKLLSKEEQKRLWVVPFISEELPAVFQQSTVIVSRAGGTIAEIAAVRAPSVLIPLSTAAQNHQAANAQVLEEAGAAVVVDETKCNAEMLADVILELVKDGSKRQELAKAIAQFDHPEAAESIAKLLLFP